MYDFNERGNSSIKRILRSLYKNPINQLYIHCISVILFCCLLQMMTTRGKRDQLIFLDFLILILISELKKQ